jgi:hypothetical protein
MGHAGSKDRPRRVAQEVAGMIRFPDMDIAASADAKRDALRTVIEGNPMTSLAGSISFVSPWT